MNKQILLDNLRSIPDWPIKGVNFRDVTTLFKNAEALKEISDEMYELYQDKGITKIVGIESRGFVGTMEAACKLVKKFHPKKVYCNFIIELHKEFPNSRKIFEDNGIEVTSLLKF